MLKPWDTFSNSNQMESVSPSSSRSSSEVASTIAVTPSSVAEMVTTPTLGTSSTSTSTNDIVQQATSKIGGVKEATKTTDSDSDSQATGQSHVDSATSTSKPSSNQTLPSSSPSNGLSSNKSANAVSAAGVTSFLGVNTGIGSWFHTDLASDSTNGNSWCGCPYTDSTPGFAPSVGTMLKNFGGDYSKAGKAFCGLEAKFTAPDGKTSLLYIADGFDDKWFFASIASSSKFY